MSDSPTNSSTELYIGPAKVLPRHINDPTILDSVAGFINEVVPTSHTGSHDIKDQIQWAKFENIESENPAVFQVGTYISTVPSTLILILGYTTGIQVWAVPANGEATEILSWRHGFVKAIKFLPVPYIVGNSTKKDLFESKRPLLAVCDSSSAGPQFSSLNFVSLLTGEQVKVIKFKNPVIDVLANKQFIVVSFQEKIAVFDAFTLEDHTTVTTCYLSPGVNPNPISLGTNWLAYAEKKLNLSKKSCGGMHGEGVQSYTATVIHAAKSLGRGLRELGESVASSLTGTNTYKPGTSPNSPQAGGQLDVPHKGIVTVLDISSPNLHSMERCFASGDPVVAHFAAHTEAVVALQFDPSGMLLLTADKRGHDFHLFRIHPHPGSSVLGSVHHLYILHRGDTSARVQDVAFTHDSRWVCVSTLRGTTHVFPVTPYGGNVGMRTHATMHVVNKMSRFHRSAGLSVDGRSNSPISMAESPSNSRYPHYNPRFPPYPHPTVVNPLAQIRPPAILQNAVNTPSRTQTGRQRIPSSSEETVSLRIVSCFGAPRALLDVNRDNALIRNPKPVDSLFIMSCHGILVQYDLDPHQQSNIPKERVSSDTPIELRVAAKAQWLLQRKNNGVELVPPMTKDNLAYIKTEEKRWKKNHQPDCNDEQWLSQVEIMTHAGPHRRLWMGPQFTFKTYKTIAGSPLSVGESQPIDVRYTKPINMPITNANHVLIESGSASSSEQQLLENYQKSLEEGGGIGELRLKEDLADAMLESPGIRDIGGRCVIVQMKPAVAKVVNPLGTVVNVQSGDEPVVEVFEETIHENCDETLFRPIVAPKIIPNKNKVYYDENILTKSLDSTTEVAVNILRKSTDGQTRNEDSKNSKNETVAGGKVEPIFDLSDHRPRTNLDEIEYIERTFVDYPLENDDFFSLENLKVDHFQEATEPPHSNENKKPKMNRNNLENLSENNSSEENVIEEKVVAKRNRKPKTKLGVKIASVVNNENTNPDKVTDPPAGITLPAPPKKSWSSIAVSKPKTIIDCRDIDSQKIVFGVEEQFTVQLPKKTPPNISDFIDINVSEDEKIDTDTDKDIFSLPDDAFLSTSHKCSDEEKCDLSSSPAEATESDDSGKLPSTAFIETKITSTSKNSKKKKKKK
ncbi:breast carcinoma-amplified sequence 3 homolog [Diorhabda sublineata]|uniref:breast carcinoma-amplified sequence 3 homolog n=1 Tax=Diorhabda sublineata TaxID=1163346 RepID=UPI0024E18876|nr:breast carcinoma-amplified sequence 3 homolog [Diorhabda sublineata]XP_056641627.1 breast carcinoma-amplified sequence 3 homolog [Diorhabda sublineata]